MPEGQRSRPAATVGNRRRQGLLGGELHVPEKLRAAIGAALGERAQAVVLSDSDSATASVRLLLHKDAERTGIVVAGHHQPPDTGFCAEWHVSLI